MAPRERRVETQGFALLSGPAAQKLIDSTKPAAGPEVRRAPREEPAPVAPEPSAASVANAAPGQVAALVNASANGSAFCEECARQEEEATEEETSEGTDEPQDDEDYAPEEEDEASESESSEQDSVA